MQRRGWIIGGAVVVIVACLVCVGVLVAAELLANRRVEQTVRPTARVVIALTTVKPTVTDTVTPEPTATIPPTYTPSPESTATETSTATNTTASTTTSIPPTKTAIPPTRTPPPTAAPQRLTGRGQQATDLFQLSAGLALFDLTHDGSENFAIWLLNGSGERMDLLVNEIGPFQGGRALGVPASGSYVLDIEASGNWSVVVNQPSSATELKAPQTFTGQGQRPSPLFQLGVGLTRFHLKHNGKSNFAVWLLNSRGEHVDLLVNEIGEFDGSKAVGIRQTGSYILDISADGPWTIDVQ